MAIRTIHHSRSWRLAAAARRLLAIPLPYGTRRRAVAAKMVRAVIRRVTGTGYSSPPVTVEADS